MSSDPGLYDYIPYNRRPKITWPNGGEDRGVDRAEYRILRIRAAAQPAAHPVGAAAA